MSTKAKSAATSPTETLRQLSQGVHPQRVVRGPEMRVVEAVESGLLPATPRLADDLRRHRAALRAWQLQRAREGGAALAQAAAAVWAQLEAGQDVRDVDLELLHDAAAADAAEAPVRGVLDEWVLGTANAVSLAVTDDVDRLIATGVRPLLESVNRAWQPLLDALADRDPRRPELFLGLGDDRGRQALHGAAEVAERLAQARQLYRDLVDVRVDDRTFGALEDAGVFDRPSGGPVEGDALDRLVVAGVQPQWAPVVHELRGAIGGRSQVLDPRDVERRRTELAKQTAAREAQTVAAARAQAEQRSRDLAAAADRTPAVSA